VKGTLTDTDYESFKSQLEELEKDRLEKERKQREIQKRSNFHYEFEEFEDDFKDTDAPLQGGTGLFNPTFVFGLLLVSGIVYFLFIKKGSSNEEIASEVDDDDE
jgi:hypothetical protein